MADTEPAAASVEGDELTLEDRGLAIAYRCRLLREQGRAAIVEATAERAGTRWRPLLLPVAKRLRDTLGELLEHIPQDGLVDGLVAHDPIVLNQVEGILTQDLGSLLTIMGYTPPPAQDVLTVDLLDAVHEYTIAATRTGGILTNTTDVYTSIYAFKYNLSRLITECERDESPAAAPVDERHLQAAVLSAVGTGCDALLPGMIAAAGIAIVFPPAGTAAAAHILVGAAGGAAAKDALGRTLKGAAGYVTGKWLKGSPTRTDADLCAAVELLAYDLRVIGAASKPLEGHEQARATATAAIGVAVTDLLTIVRGYCLRGLGEAQLEQICRLALDLLDECRDENAVPIPDSVFAVAGGTFTDMADTLDGWVARHSSR